MSDAGSGALVDERTTGEACEREALDQGMRSIICHGVGHRVPAGRNRLVATGSPTASLTESGTLPSGVTFVDDGNGTATLAGTAATGAAGTYHLTITAANGVAPRASQNFI